MPMNNLGSTLAIANPAAHSGRGAVGAEHVKRFFEICPSASTSFELRLTGAPGDARRIAAQTAGFDTVIAVGGDGVIHEVVNGLMEIAPGRRPRLGIVPLGSGNDFARTLALKPNDPNAALRMMLTGREKALDLGRVTSDACPEGVYFTESLSFGLDAAIALDTTKRRAEGTRQEGEGLFLTSSIRLALRASKGYPCVARIDGGEPLELTALIFAVLNGPTYGGGFRICPQADPCDGELDLCYNVRKPWMPHLMFLLALARFGRHTRSSYVRLRKLHEAHIEYAGEVPCQVDGEQFSGTSFSFAVVPNALRVIVPRELR